MNSFDFWTKWGIGLSDKDFANAFTALGILAAKSRAGSSSRPESHPAVRNIMRENTVYESLREITGISTDLAKNPIELLWRFPIPNYNITLGLIDFNLANLNPQLLANAWHKITVNLPSQGPFPPLRLRVLNYPTESGIRPWFRMLFESEPEKKSVYIDFSAPNPQLHMKWPLRMGYIPGNNAEKAIKTAHNLWPSSINATVTEIGRENDNCDFLIYTGSTEQLLKQIHDLPVPMKCNLFIIMGKSEDGNPGFHDRIREITSLSHASGLVFCDTGKETPALADILNHIVEELSHNNHIDSAISASFIKSGRSHPDLLVFMSKALADFRLEHQVKKTIRKIQKMPAKATIKVSASTLPRLNIPHLGGVISDVSELRNVFGTKRAFENIDFGSESHAATGLSEINKVLKKAVMPEKVKETRRERYISARTFCLKKDQYVENKKAFLVDVPARANIWIGPPQKGVVRIKTSFPIEKLPPQADAWTLTVVLSEPTHIPEPLMMKIKLPQDGPSTECVFDFTPKEAVPFEGSITILHRGRIIQTAVLKIPVVETISKMPKTNRMRISDIIPVKTNLGDLEKRTQYDIAFATTQTKNHKPYLTAIATDHAWLVNLEACQSITEEINTALSMVALSVEDYKLGFESEKGKELLKSLVFSGCELYSAIIEEQLDRQGNMAEIIKKDYLQIVSTKNDNLIPFEFIYDYEVPDDDAELCPDWKAALQKGKCPGDCAKRGSETICPLGFWGLRKVIERHAVTYELAVGNKENFLQSEMTTERSELKIAGQGLLAASNRVAKKEAQAVEKTFKKAFGNILLRPEDWSNWESMVIQNKPCLILALPHTNGSGSKATLEIGNKTIKSIQVKLQHVRPDEEADFPIVALLGCDTTGSAIDYSSYIQQFRRKGAAIVIGTIATVFGGDAAKVANMLVEGLTNKSAQSERMGEILRTMKRKAVLNGLLMALCVVAYGDADWKLTK